MKIMKIHTWKAAFIALLGALRHPAAKVPYPPKALQKVGTPPLTPLKPPNPLREGLKPSVATLWLGIPFVSSQAEPTRLSSLAVSLPSFCWHDHTAVLRKNAVRKFVSCQISLDKMFISEENSGCFSLQFSDTFDYIFETFKNFPEN